jgi:hypothetical protein
MILRCALSCCVAIKQISTASCSCFAVTTAGKLYAWGFGDLGQLGTGEEQDENTPVDVSSKSKALRGQQVVQVGAGGQHTVVLVADAAADLVAPPAVVAAVSAAAASGAAAGQTPARGAGGHGDDAVTPAPATTGRTPGTRKRGRGE